MSPTETGLVAITRVLFRSRSQSRASMRRLRMIVRINLRSTGCRNAGEYGTDNRVMIGRRM
eukprot:8201427-Pyramimonas_sp.AAC.2